MPTLFRIVRARTRYCSEGGRLRRHHLGSQRYASISMTGRIISKVFRHRPVTRLMSTPECRRSWPPRRALLKRTLYQRSSNSRGSREEHAPKNPKTQIHLGIINHAPPGTSNTLPPRPPGPRRARTWSSRVAALQRCWSYHPSVRPHSRASRL
jgi:hypothetical protein